MTETLAFTTLGVALLLLQTPDPTSTFNNATSIGQVLIFLTMILGYGVTLYTQNRARKWEMEDRARIARELEERLNREAEDRTRVADALKAQIADNTNISQQAFKEANSVNNKIATAAAGHEETLRAVQHVTEVATDTNTLVRALKEEPKP